MGHCVWRLGTIAWLLVPGTAWAQLAPVGVPAGVVRAEFDGTIDIWDSRYRDGTREPLGTDLSSSTLGSNLLAPLSDADARIGRITGLTGYHLNLGTLTTDAQADESHGFFGLGLGVTRWLTVFGRIPLVRSRVQTAITLDGSGGDAGLNPGETPELARAKKAAYLERYKRDGAGNGWHFLTGDPQSISALTRAVGFRYAYNAEVDQYAQRTARTRVGERLPSGCGVTASTV